VEIDVRLSGWMVGKPSLTGLWKGCPSYEDNPFLRRSMRIQHYVHVKIPETIPLAAEGVDPGLVRRPPIER
jgi:hypothetical protein